MNKSEKNKPKLVRIFFVDSETNLVNQFEDLVLNNPEWNIRIIKKRTTKNKFMNEETRKKYWEKTDIFIFAASLPDGSSIEMIESLKSQTATENKKIIFLVNKQTRHFIDLAKQNNVDRILMKPVNARELLKAIDELREQ